MSNEFTKLAIRHPVRYSLVTGGFLAAVILVIFRLHLAVALAFGALLALLNWVLWRPGGIARRNEDEDTGDPVNWREIIKFIMVTLVLTGLMILTYGLVE